MRTRVVLGVLLAVAGYQTRPETPVDPSEPAAVRAVEASGLHNAFRVSERVYSGSSPDGETGFADLERLGVKTIISVDGARPDVEAARRHGLTYVHLPFGYDGIPRDRVLALAKAARDLPGPIYVHCHHGKHRGPAAVAAIQLCNDPTWDAATAEGWLKTAGTDPRYAGLIGLPRSLMRPTLEELTGAPTSFKTSVTVPDLARLMVEIDTRWDHLKLVKAGGWTVPQSHPDIDPPHEALQLAELYREAARLDAANRRGPDFIRMLRDAEVAASELEQALQAKPVDPNHAELASAHSSAACAACHDRFRDRPTNQ